MKQPKIAVIGDLCLDMYYFLTEDRTESSVETGLKTRSVKRTSYQPGGAGNVAVNLMTLGAGKVDIYGIIGDDPWGAILKSRLETEGVNCSRVRIQKTGWQTHVYHKFYTDDHEEPRCDIGNFNLAEEDEVDRILSDLEKEISGYDLVIINEQIAHGYHNERFRTGLLELISKHEDDCLWITDCRHLNDFYNYTIRKLNVHEARAIYKEKTSSDSFPNDSELLKRLYSYWKKPTVITLGEEGVLSIDDSGTVSRTYGINIIGRTDTVGAGDAFLSGFALSLASGDSISSSARSGNFAAAVSVTKLFETGNPSAAEVAAMQESPDYRYNPEKAADSRTAVFAADSHIEIIEDIRSDFPKVAIFDHDGTISTLRQGWEPIMQEVCMAAVMGEALHTADSDEIRQIEGSVSEMIEKTTGVQTIIQMKHLRDMVISYGYVPSEKILETGEYKEIYNRRLLEMVSERVSLFRRGLLELCDVTMKGAVDFLRLLYENGTLLYLASGTDQQDVQDEAAVLGYAEYFNGGIFGSEGRADRDPKRLVIENIIRDLPEDIRSRDCCVFGDGPVEMREGAKRNFTRIGIVSDERCRFGINNEKRSRLILGGAQMLIPDFSWAQILGKQLGWKKI